MSRVKKREKKGKLKTEGKIDLTDITGKKKKQKYK